MSVLDFELNREEKALLNQLKVIGEFERILCHPSFSEKTLKKLLNDIQPVDLFYRQMGGIQGYHEKVRALLSQKKENGKKREFHPPTFTDISEKTQEVEKTIQWGLEALPFLAQIVPLGGAADRLHLVDENTGKELPAALLRFAGKTLLERLVEDLEALERMFFQKFRKKITIPIGFMTSEEKENHFHIERVLREKDFFGRPEDSIQIFKQPLVPAVDKDGNWLFLDNLKLVMKPGGHGAIWKQAEDSGIFSWFELIGKTKLLVRQINNPIAGLDYGLLSFLGIGFKENKKFGFASCSRLLNSAEGVNVLLEEGSNVTLTNVEYCDFEKFGIEDLPLKEGEPYSRFSSNTNILFGDLPSIRQAILKSPFPGLLLNLKKGSFQTSSGQRSEAVIGRLESTMQNIADVFLEKKCDQLIPKDTFITYNLRHKTISTAKRGYVKGGGYSETPEGCFYDLLQAGRELLEKSCRYYLPPKRTIEEVSEIGPEFVFSYHPILGPLYSDIQEKLKRGVLRLGAELSLEIGDLFLENLELQGSFRIRSDGSGRCSLKNIKVANRGIDWEKSPPFWRGDYSRTEGLEIVLHEGATLTGQDLVFEGSHYIEIPMGKSVRITQGDLGEIQFASL